ncbi:MAG: leucine-rich repeat protein, partial [Clostridia bacterium]|nr:leucine-rich repeat protein [Clostridia bacterium]
MKLNWKFLAVACALFSLMCACAAAEGNVLSIPEGVKEICSEAFMNDASLETVIVPKGTFISDSAFAGCVNLKTLVFLGEELLTYDQAFSSLPIENVYCPEETEIQAYFLNLGVNVYPLSAYFADDQFEYEIVGSQAVITGYKGNDTDVQIPKAVRGLPVTKIGERAFEGNKTIVSVSIPDGIKKIGNYAFSNCTALYSIDISKTVRSIGDYAFINDRNLAIVTLSSGSVVFGENPFLNCSSLSGISVVSDGAQYSVIDGMLIDNNKLISYFTSKSAGSVTVPDGVTAVGKYAFSYAQYLDNVSVPDSCTIVDDYAFFECPSLKTVRLSENLQKIGASAFENCERLKEINLSNALLSVGDRAFKNCRSLSNCALPESVQSAGEDIFLLEETFSSSVMNIVPLYQFHY